jgi:hypothetical protein
MLGLIATRQTNTNSRAMRYDTAAGGSRAASRPVQAATEQARETSRSPGKVLSWARKKLKDIDYGKNIKAPVEFQLIVTVSQKEWPR